MKIYVGWSEGDYGSSGYLQSASLDRFAFVKKLVNDSMNADDIEVFDSETQEYLYNCTCLHSYTDHHWCSCPDCKDNDETVRWLVENHIGNYHK